MIQNKLPKIAVLYHSAFFWQGETRAYVVAGKFALVNRSLGSNAEMVPLRGMPSSYYFCLQIA